MSRSIVAAAALIASPVYAGGPLGADATVAGPRTQVMTLASTHLSEHDGWTASMLEPLIAKLVAFKPRIVTHEGVSGEQCEAMRVFPDLYADTVDQYCWDPSSIRAKTRLSVSDGLREVRHMLATWPAQPTAAQRRQLAVLFLAAGDRSSAAVQWLRLAPTERVASDGIDDAMLAILERKGKKLNESIDVAAVVAARLGLERVYAVDDHSSDAALVDEGKEFEDAIARHFATVRALPELVRIKNREKSVTSAAAMLDYYRAMNAAGAQDAIIRADFGGAIKQLAPGTPARRYVGWWDVRNLRMAANIRATFAARAGVRVLNIVGASHKPWYDALMAVMADVDVVDSAAVLR
ncbi:MAG: DUF5694 domain-containing protein [Sphingomicrobium sp.]